MARRDRTYSAQDLIRFYQKNLTRREQAVVLDVLCRGIRDRDRDQRRRVAFRRTLRDLQEVGRLLGTVATVINLVSLIPGPQRPVIRALTLAINGATISINGTVLLLTEGS